MPEMENILTEDQVIDMCDFIDDHIHIEFDEATNQLNSLCDHSLKWTKEWIASVGLNENEVLDFVHLQSNPFSSVFFEGQNKVFDGEFPS